MYKYTGVDHPMTGTQREIVPFLACGDLAGWDADRTYPLEVSNNS
jgi:tRNA (cytidine32/guanosine34-2'-O)-methyltransferase